MGWKFAQKTGKIASHMKYAVIRLQGHQYKVEEKEEILVDKLSLASSAGRLKDPKKIEADVLLVSDEGKVKVGKPRVKGAEVGLKLVEEEVKGEKLYIRKFKAKSRYRRKTGFRPKYSKLLVQKISL